MSSTPRTRRHGTTDDTHPANATANATDTSAGIDIDPADAGPAPVSRNPRLTGFWKVVVLVLTLAGLLLTINQVFFLNLFGLALLTNSYLYLLVMCFVPILLITVPAGTTTRPGAAASTDATVTTGTTVATGTTDAGDDEPVVRTGVPWYDVLLILTLMGTTAYFAVNGVDIQEYGWSFVAPPVATVMSFVFWALILEVLRRGAGWIVAALALLVSLYPIGAGTLPVAFLEGIQYEIDILAQTHAMGGESILGLPLQTAGSILVGFLLFGVVLQHTGGATFFYELSMALFGRYRGGSAKVSVASSAAMGMMSGSAVGNVLTTGPLTIPAMIRSGFSRKTAGAVEATAASGGSITPPIMGTAAFLMVSFVGVSYTEILIAATIPAFLYFFGIFVQIDGYAAQRGLRGTDKAHLPRLGAALLSGWPYLASLALLTVMLFTTGNESQVPFYVVAVLLVIALVTPGLRFGPREWTEMVLDIGSTLAQIIGIIAGVGLILGGLSATGVALSLSRDLVALVGDNVVLILIAGALACFVLGMGLTISAAYVFLAIVMAPAVIELGVDPIAAHLFVIYWASVSYITPPVGLAAFAAAGISKASPMATCVEAMRLGMVKYIVPFGFALNPALVAQAPTGEVVLNGLASVVAVFAIACAFSGWFTGVEVRLGVPLRAALAVGGFMMFLPQGLWTLVGLGIVLAVAAAGVVRRRATGHDRPDRPVTEADSGSEHPEQTEHPRYPGHPGHEETGTR